MYDVLPSFVMGFHGCDRAVAERVFAGKAALRASINDYDWLGHGIYFWENNPGRAMAWARTLKRTSIPTKQTITNPAVIGAVIDLGHCMNLLDTKFIGAMKTGYEELRKLHQQAGTQMPANRPLRGSKDLLLRHLDCAVIEMLHYTRQRDTLPEFQSVRGVFIEGPEIYPNAGVHEFNHIQICVRDPRGIKGYFRVLEEPSSPKIIRR